MGPGDGEWDEGRVVWKDGGVLVAGGGGQEVYKADMVPALEEESSSGASRKGRSPGWWTGK